MERQAKPEGTFARPYTGTHTFIYVRAVSVQVEFIRVAAGQFQKDVICFFLMGSQSLLMVVLRRGLPAERLCYIILLHPLKSVIASSLSWSFCSAMVQRGNMCIR